MANWQRNRTTLATTCSHLLVISLGAISIFVEFAPAEEIQKDAAEFAFALHVQPILAEKCFSCHGNDPDELRGELNLKSLQGILAGGETSNKVLVPGKPQQSLLYVAATWDNDDYQMPPKENDRLSVEQLSHLEKWIAAGAPWPSDQRITEIRESSSDLTGAIVKTSGGLSESWDNRRYDPKNLWAYQPLDVKKPEIKSNGFAIDSFINRRLDELELTAAPRAARRTLIRRVTFDLTGLPPTPAEVDSFINDPDDDKVAMAKVVDRLLSSDHYGEQSARMWLDVVRYADTSGMANDYERPNAWRYRDYVIRSFNNDKSYADFIREQLAGDEIDPDDPEKLIAVGFLRMGPWEQTGMSVARVTRQQFLDDVTDAVGQVFLSHPLQCCRCHDHKFDPIPTRDYYRVQAVFATTQFADRPAAFSDDEEIKDRTDQQLLQSRIKRYEKTLQDLQKREEEEARKWYAERDLEYAPRAELRKRGVPEYKIAPRRVGLTTAQLGMERICRKNLTRHRWELDRFRPFAFSVFSGHTRFPSNVSSRQAVPEKRTQGKLQQISILAGGDLFSPTEKVTPGVLSCIAVGEIPNDIEGRRLALANWIADPKNPITARSYVNRIWQQHFGTGIVATPNNFGATGSKPTHPKLLDWLASTFVNDGWSTKKLHRRILSSDAYCRSSSHESPDHIEMIDPNNESLAVFPIRRLAAEEIRDAMLSVSGELNKKIGGPPVRPNINNEVALQPRQIMGTYAPAYQPSIKPEQRNRRSVYGVRIRGLRDPLLEVFNQPTSDKSCSRRENSTVTPQALAMLNGENTVDRSIATSILLQSRTKSDDEAIVRLFQLAYGREPTAGEKIACLSHWRKMTEEHLNSKPTPTAIPTVIERSAVEENNGEVFTYVEELETNQRHIPDRKPWDVDARTRGLADVCAVIFNSNEFIYIP